ncbi:hypothetical protein BJ742DRAFT_774066 [Cladochytrium replicatum]|nr:hypothetical protein BJ742DRAFT_774066 [Cladochytrium replicatum]
MALATRLPTLLSLPTNSTSRTPSASAPASLPVTNQTPSTLAAEKRQAATKVAPTTAAAAWFLLIDFIPTAAQYGPHVAAIVRLVLYMLRKRIAKGELNIEKPNPKSTHERNHGYKGVKGVDTGLPSQIETIEKIAALLPRDVNINTSKDMNSVIPLINAFSAIYKSEEQEQIQLVKYMVENYKFDLLKPNVEDTPQSTWLARFENIGLLQMMLGMGIVSGNRPSNTISKMTVYTPSKLLLARLPKW